MYESNMDVLSLVYDSIEEIRDGYYIVKDGKGWKVVDAGNNIMIEPSPLEIVHIGNKIYVADKYAYHPYSIYDFKELKNELNPIDIRPLEQNRKSKAFAVMDDYHRVGLMNNNGNLVLPCLYRAIYLERSTSTNHYLKVYTAYELQWEEDKWREERRGAQRIIANADYTKVDCYCALETDVEDIQIVMTKFSLFESFANRLFDTKYKIRYQGKVVGKEFDMIHMSMAYSRLGFVLTINYEDKKRDSFSKPKIGAQTFDGKTLVECGDYKSLEYIGNGIFLAGNDSGYGTLIDGKEITKVGELDSTSIYKNIPITMGLKGKQTYFVGNDGRIYTRLEEAFPIYKSKLNSNVNLINLYGTWIVIDNNLNRLTNIDASLKDINTFSKLE